jgi:hypothetical protein
MSSSNDSLSLTEFAATRPNASNSRWIDGLPQEIVDEIMAGTAGSKVISDWLQTRGFPDATPGKCMPLVDARKKLAVG